MRHEGIEVSKTAESGSYRSDMASRARKGMSRHMTPCMAISETFVVGMGKRGMPNTEDNCC